MAAQLPFSEVTRLDVELVRLARGASAVRLAVGAALDALWSSNEHHELGFSSFEAYTRERCERSGRWAADTRALARKLRSLPQTRAALVSGAIGWSTAELLARHVTSETEAEWLEKSRGCTVRELRALLARSDAEVMDNAEDEPTRTLTVTAAREDGWLFECARKVAEAVAGPMPADRLLQTLLAEGYSTLFELVPDAVRAGLYELEAVESDLSVESDAQAAWCAERKRWRNDAEVLCESRKSLPAIDARDVTSIAVSSFERPEWLDREIRRLCSELSHRDLALGIVAESARKAEVWRRLGFATEAQYARERLGVSLSSLKTKRILAARAGRVPELAVALSSGRVGYEAAYLLSRVATRATAEEWIRCAERRTGKHLREELEAAELLIRMGQGRDQLPLDGQSLDELFELERCIVSGDLFGRRGDTKAGDCSQREAGGANDERAGRWHAGQMSGARLGRITFRWGVGEGTHRYFRALERVFTRVSTQVCRAPVSFLRFLCENFCRLWLPALRRQKLTDTGDEPEYFGVYRRDVFRCTSPVCTRRDVTPHHLKFRSCGGGDEDENVTSLCVWCHLFGVHQGRIAAEPPASRIRWRIGRNGTLCVEGRMRVPAGN
jgi:hypothetical protein